jgi:poly-gamma-glutamate synthesis protein (capsule biosynthesis protein)
MSALKNALRLLALALICLQTPANAEPLRLIFVGDIMLDDGPGRVIQSGRDPLAHFAATLAQADFTIGNLECPIATTGQPMESKIYSFRAHPRVLPILKGRFNALAVANNHSGDYGKDAFLETLSLLEQHDLPYFGGGRNLTAAHAPLWIEQKGLRIALLGYNEFKPRSFEAGPDWVGIAWSEDSQVIADIRAARAAGADLIIPFMHWGWERELQPSARQRQLARTMIDAGADMVIGGHPHVTQGAEYYKGKLIVYSLGNFVFDGFDPPEIPETREGWLLRLSVDRNGLIEWDTVAARMDQEGTPHLAPGAMTPCGRKGETAIRQCENP